MAYGINLRNKNNEIMFSSENISYHFAGKYTATNVGSFRCEATFTCNGTPIVFMDGGSGNNVVGLLQLQSNGSNSWTATVGGRTLGNVGLTSLDIYVFEFPDAPPTSGYGIWCKDDAGNTTLNLDQRLLKISGAYDSTAQSSSTSSTPPNQAMTFGTIPADYIVAASIIGEILTPNGPNSILLGMGPYRVNSTTVGLFGTFVYSIAAGPAISSYRVYEEQYVIFADKTLYQ